MNVPESSAMSDLSSHEILKERSKGERKNNRNTNGDRYGQTPHLWSAAARASSSERQAMSFSWRLKKSSLVSLRRSRSNAGSSPSPPPTVCPFTPTGGHSATRAQVPLLDAPQVLQGQANEPSHGREPRAGGQQVQVGDITEGAETEGPLWTADQQTVT